MVWDYESVLVVSFLNFGTSWGLTDSREVVPLGTN